MMMQSEVDKFKIESNNDEYSTFEFFIRSYLKKLLYSSGAGWWLSILILERTLIYRVIKTPIIFPKKSEFFLIFSQEIRFFPKEISPKSPKFFYRVIPNVFLLGLNPCGKQ
jgi:hypothetical protein